MEMIVQCFMWTLNSIIGTRILVIFRERIPHKTFIKRKELAIGILYFSKISHEIELIKCYSLLKLKNKQIKNELYRRAEGKVNEICI